MTPLYEYKFHLITVIMQHTPENTRQAQASPHGAGFQTPPPVGMMMSNDQFRELIETCKSESAGAGAGAGVGAADADFPGVNSVAVKLHTFWTHDPDLWFLQTEAVFPLSPGTRQNSIM